LSLEEGINQKERTMKRFAIALGLVGLAAVAAAQVLGVPRFSQSLTAAAVGSSVVSYELDADEHVTFRVSGENVTTARFSKAFLYDGSFEDRRDALASTPISPTAAQLKWGGRGTEDNWTCSTCDQTDDTLGGPWTISEAANDVDFDQAITTARVGLGRGVPGSKVSLLMEVSGIDGNLSETDSEMAFEDWTATDPDGWTTTEGGDGSVTEDTTNEHTAGGSAAIVTAGSGGEESSVANAITVTAEAEYTVVVWTKAGTGDDCAIRIQESGVGAEYLTSAGAWQAGAADWSTDSTTTWNMDYIFFTVETGETEITLTYAADDASDVCNIDDVTITLQTESYIEQDTLDTNLFGSTGTADYVFGFIHSDGGTDSLLQYQLRDNTPGVAGSAYWTGSAWSATETWITAPNVGTTATRVLDYFGANDGVTLPHSITVSFRVQAAGTEEDITIDDVFIAESSLAGDLPIDAVTVIDRNWAFMTHARGRVAIHDDGTGTTVIVSVHPHMPGHN
jgi:hypothetical protein